MLFYKKPTLYQLPLTHTLPTENPHTACIAHRGNALSLFRATPPAAYTDRAALTQRKVDFTSVHLHFGVATSVCEMYVNVVLPRWPPHPGRAGRAGRVHRLRFRRPGKRPLWFMSVTLKVCVLLWRFDLICVRTSFIRRIIVIDRVLN